MRRWLGLRESRGLTFRELSAQTGVPANTLAHWAWKLRREDAAKAKGATGFVELVARCDAPEPGGRIEIELGGGRRVIVQGDVGEAALRRVLQVLERC